jgi:hypothetical protein
MNPSTATTADQPLVGDALERRLEELLYQDRFAPPTGFLAADPAVMAELQSKVAAARSAED